jgi:hypothetical protein
MMMKKMLGSNQPMNAIKSPVLKNKAVRPNTKEGAIRPSFPTVKKLDLIPGVDKIRPKTGIPSGRVVSNSPSRMFKPDFSSTSAAKDIKDTIYDNKDPISISMK